MAKIAKHFTVTKHFPNKMGRIEFSGIVYKNNPEHYDIEDVRYFTGCDKQIMEDITNWFKTFRELTDPEFHHDDIVELLTGWLYSDEGKDIRSLLKHAA
jgi:hypothetical protein